MMTLSPHLEQMMIARAAKRISSLKMDNDNLETQQSAAKEVSLTNFQWTQIIEGNELDLLLLNSDHKDCAGFLGQNNMTDLG